MKIVVIGAGTNGLAAASWLGRHGHQVVVLEGRPRAGGLAADEPLAPGLAPHGILHDTRLVRRETADELGLLRFGLQFSRSAPAVTHLGDEGTSVTISDDGNLTGSPPPGADGVAQDRYRRFVRRVAPVFRRALNEPPPDLLPAGLFGVLGWLRLGLSVRRLGESDLFRLARVLPMCAADWFGEWFKSPLVRASYSAPSLEAGFVGPWSPGTAVLALLRDVGSDEGIRGGPAALVAALLEACRYGKVDVRLDARVREIGVAQGRVRGVVLDGGDDLPADVVLSTIDPRTTLLDLVSPSELPLDLERAASNLRMRGTSAKLDLIVAEPPRFGAIDVPVGTVVRTGGSVDELERAFDDAKYRRCSRRPTLEIVGSDLADGRMHLSVLAHFAPWNVEGGFTGATSAALEESILAELARHAPNVRDRVVAKRLRTPADLERELGLFQGHLHHGEHAPDQLFSMRPTPSCARYATPIAGLYLGGSGSHPGGGLSCAPGLLAAKAIGAAK